MHLLSPNERSQLLNTRHSEGELAQLIPAEQFIEADYFLFLRGQLQTASARKEMLWRPWSIWHMRNRVPRYLSEAVYLENANKLLRPLGVQNITELRSRLATNIDGLSGMFAHSMGFDPRPRFSIEEIGTK